MELTDVLQQILSKLDSLEIGQANLEKSFSTLETSQARLESNQARLESNQAKLEANQAKLEANQIEFRAEVNAKFDEVNAKFDEVNAKFDAINHRFEVLEQDMREMHVILEYRLPKQIQLIAEQYGDVIKNQKALELEKERNAQTRDRVAILETVVKEHTAAIAELQAV